MKIIRRRDLVETPWKNGGGITRNIAQDQDDRGLLWRLSMADVATEGAFSSFAGLTRILTVIEGDGMVLHTPDGDLLAAYACPLRFDGGVAVTATLPQGPIRDFNLMFDTARCAGDAHVLGAGPDTSGFGQSGRIRILHVIAGAVSVRGTELAVGDTLIEAGDDAPLLPELTQDGRVLAITLRRLD